MKRDKPKPHTHRDYAEAIKESGMVDGAKTPYNRDELNQQLEWDNLRFWRN